MTEKELKEKDLLGKLQRIYDLGWSIGWEEGRRLLASGDLQNKSRRASRVKDQIFSEVLAEFKKLEGN